jgi:hypothetical protein
MDQNNFRVSEDGNYTPLLYNEIYTLIHTKYANIFQSLIGQVTVNSGNIHDFVLRTENRDYVELTVQNKIDLETIDQVSTTKKNVWTYNGRLFVSAELKSELENVGGCELEFSLGFSNFAA